MFLFLMNHGVHLKRLRQPSPRLLAQIQDVKEGPGTVGVVNVPHCGTCLQTQSSLTWTKHTKK